MILQRSAMGADFFARKGEQMAKTYSIVKIDGVEMPAPSDFSPTSDDYDSKSAGRSENMFMTRDIIRSNVRTASFTWKLQTPDMRKVWNAVLSPKIKVTFFDLAQPADTQYSTMDCYADPSRKPKLLKWDPDDPEKSWWEFTTTFTEY